MVVLGGSTACSESVISTYTAWLLKHCSVKCLGMSLTSGTCVIRLGTRLTTSMCCRMQQQHAVPRHDWACQSQEGFVRHTGALQWLLMSVQGLKDVVCHAACASKETGLVAGK